MAVRPIIEALDARRLLAASPASHINPGTAGTLIYAGTKVGNGDAAVFAAAGALWRSDGTAAGTTQLRSGFNPDADSSPTFASVGGVAYASIVPTGQTFTQLWRTDGTPGGTSLLLAQPSAYVNRPVDCNGTLYFTVTGQNRRELWKSNGTTGGTSMVRAFEPYAQLATSGFASLNGRVYFTAETTASGIELWSTDGTAAGTSQLIDLYPGSTGSSPSRLTASNGLLYFGASTANSGNEPWRSDGTVEGTFKLREVRSGSSSSFPTDFVAVNGTTTLFIADGYLYRTTGTAASTVRVNPSTTTDSPYGFSGLTRVGNAVYAAAYSSPGEELWKSDGTDAGTMLVKDINASSSGSPRSLFNVNGTLFFTATDAEYGQQLWKSDGTTGGTTRVARWENSTDGYSLGSFMATSARLLFARSDPIIGRELFATDGTAAGTGLAKDLQLAPIRSEPEHGFAANGKYVVSAIGPGAQARTWWTIDPATGSTTDSAVNTVPQGFNGWPVRSIDFAGGLVHTSGGYGIYYSDGTAVNTRRLTFADAHAAYGPQFTRAANDKLFFTARPGNFASIYASDGTAAGTTDLLPSTPLSSVTSIASVGDVTYFVGRRFAFGSPDELWRSDGTVGGTTSIMTWPIANGASVARLAGLNGKLYIFRHMEESVGQPVITRLFECDAATGATLTPIIDFNNFAEDIGPPLTVGRRFYFSSLKYGSTDGGHTLWVSDGTAAGTLALLPYNGTSGTTIVGTLPDNRVLFRQYDNATGSQQALYLTDGTVAGTMKLVGGLTDIGMSSTAFANGQFFFAATDATHGRELWATDGTPGGTRRVTDIMAGSASSNPDGIAAVNGTIFFGATFIDPASGSTDREVWKLPDVFAPIVSSARFEPDASQPTLLVRFNESVDAVALASAIRVIDRATGAIVPGISVSYDAATATASVRLPTTLADGNYRLTIEGGSVADAAGNTLGRQLAARLPHPRRRREPRSQGRLRRPADPRPQLRQDRPHVQPGQLRLLGRRQRQLRRPADPRPPLRPHARSPHRRRGRRHDASKLALRAGANRLSLIAGAPPDAKAGDRSH
jgi:ELWxxDGT repeat protein